MMELQTYEREHIERLRSTAAECALLLKKAEAGEAAFPLAAPGRIAVYGNGVRYTQKGGTGSGEVNSRYSVSIEDGLEQCGFQLTTKTWLDSYDCVRREAEAAFIREIRRRARKNHTLAVFEGMGAVMPEPEYTLPLDTEEKAEAAVYVVSRICGEGNDRTFAKGDMALTDTEVRDILALQRRYARFMLVLNTGGPVFLEPVREVSTILVLSQLGVETGLILGRLLLGLDVPSGKLTATWPLSEADWPAAWEFGHPDDTRYTEGIHVGYRNPALRGFCFGHGLTYTAFTIGGLQASLAGAELTVSARVTNTGAYPGKEVVQVYVRVPEGRLPQPDRRLAGFAKTALLQPQESADVHIRFSLAELASYDEESAAWILEPGDYTILAGSSAACTEAVCRCRLEHEVQMRQSRNVLGKPDFSEKTRPRTSAAAAGESAMLPVLPVEDTAIRAGLAAENREAETEAEIAPEIAALSDEQLAYLAVGAFAPRGGLLGVVGNAGKEVPGTAGETCRRDTAPLLPPLVMADGPAGLRLAREYIRDGKGARALGATMPESTTKFLSPLQQRLLKATEVRPAKGAQIRHQYATAIPIGTAIAQSWNPAFAAQCGDIVGEEMERFGVHLWLPPAVIWLCPDRNRTTAGFCGP